jgi:hypothetical protein
MWRMRFALVGVGLGIVLLVLGPGFYECWKATTCSADPCLHCVVMLLTPNVQAAILTVGLGGLIAWWYQRANKIMEFRFNTFERAMRVYSDLSSAAWSRLTLFARLETRRRREGADTESARRMRQELEQRDNDLHTAIMAGHTIIAVQSVLFPREVTDHWGRIMTNFQTATDDDLWVTEEAIYSAPENRLAYMRGVARVIRLPFPEPKGWTREVVEHHRGAIREMLQQAQPRSKPSGGE